MSGQGGEPAAAKAWSCGLRIETASMVTAYGPAFAMVSTIVKTPGCGGA
jgi:hypothetical protein